MAAKTTESFLIKTNKSHYETTVKQAQANFSAGFRKGRATITE